LQQEMRKSIKTISHVGFWLGYLLFVSIVMFAATQGKEMEPGDTSYYVVFVFGVAIVPAILSFYSHYYFLFSNYLQKRKIAASLFLSSLIAVISALAGIFAILVGNEEAANCVKEGFSYAMTFTTAIAFLFGIIAVVLKGFFKWFSELKLKEELLEQNHRMQLALIKSQLDPHFLFNTINNIDVLIEREPKEASQYLNKLSDILRFMLYQTRSETIPLTDELQYIEKYIELQKIRTGNQKYVSYEVVGTLNGQTIAPMVFIPFIENTFKHTNNKKLDNAVEIQIQINEENVVFKCQNKFDPDIRASGDHNGLGIELIKKRLNILYPDKHTLRIDSQEDQYNVELTIDNGPV
jgi:two-component system, LytTR family, sensor kinase